MELYYMMAVTDRSRAAAMAGLYERSGLTLTLTALAQGTATGRQLARYGLEATEKAMITGVASAEAAAALLRSAKEKLYIDIPGNGILLSVPLKSIAGRETLAYLSKEKLQGGKPRMDFEYELIVAVMNEGYSDLLMNAARSAGATGGTVLHAKGTAGEDAARFLGLRIAPEKDLVYIVAHRDEKAAIMQAIHREAGPGTEAGAICFSLPISSVVGLRQRDTAPAEPTADAENEG